MAETTTDIIKRYLEDAIAAEKSFETQLRTFAKEGNDQTVQQLFAQHADETKWQYESLTARLQALGGSTSTLKSFLAHVFGVSPKAAQLGHEEQERTTQNLMMAYAVENSEVAMYEALAVTADAVGDTLTSDLARQIQAQEKATAEKVWHAIAPAAREAFQALSAPPQETIVRYLQDAEAAERNFEDALASFGKVGDQTAVQQAFSSMSSTARAQHELLRTRLESLGGSPSTAKSMLAHVLAFTPTMAQIGHEPEEKNTQHLMIVYAAAAAEMAMYESLASSAQVAGDHETEQLARRLQSQERQDHETAWALLKPSAIDAIQAMPKAS